MAKQKRGVPTDYRKQRKKEDRNMLFLVMFVLIVVAGACIWLFLGFGEMLAAMPCLGGGAFLIALVWGIFALLERAAQD